jgi:hypothetical protein
VRNNVAGAYGYYGPNFSMASYDQFKEFRGKRYTGMAVGRSHTWKYDAGSWKERKVTPDRWEFKYSVVKRRAGRAPEGSGAPVGTAYHWYIVADQTVTKLDANSYMTEMVGHKLKVAHRRADKSSWSASEKAKRKALVKLLRELADDLEGQPIEEPVEAAAAPEKPVRRQHARPSRRTARTHGSAPATGKKAAAVHRGRTSPRRSSVSRPSSRSRNTTSHGRTQRESSRAKNHAPAR